jgi:glycosyltransferase involved in cell wall biosynthesis
VAVVLVRNAVDHDSRVLREARTLRALGFATTVLGVVSFTRTDQVTDVDGVPVRRIGPGSRAGWAVYREISRLRPAAPAAAPGGEGETGGRRGTRRVAGALRATAPARAPARRVLRWLSTLGYYARAIAAVRRLRPELVHCNDYNTMWIGVAARIMHGSAVVYDTHELWADRTLRSEPRPWLVACEALFTRLADRVLTTSPAYAEELASRYRIAPPVVVRNIPDLAAESGEVGPRSGSGDGRLAVYVGGLQPGRGLERTISALRLADDVRLRLLGPGAPEYRAGLAELIRSLELEDRVELAEPVPPRQVLDALRGADVGLALIEAVSLSYRLTLPNKLFEYALAGLPILGSDLPMIGRFLAEHAIGETVDPTDDGAIAAGLDRMLDPVRNRDYRAAAERSRASLDWGRERRLLEDVYRGALASRARELPQAPPAG